MYCASWLKASIRKQEYHDKLLQFTDIFPFT
jgi:hypothetical protein